MKHHKSSRKRKISRNGWQRGGRNLVRRSFSRKTGAIFAMMKAKVAAAAKIKLSKIKLGGKSISPTVRQSEAGQQNRFRLMPKPAAAANGKESSGDAVVVVVSPANNTHNGHPAGGSGASRNRWNSPRISGLIAAVLLLAMLGAAAFSSVGSARAGEEVPMELASAQTGSLKLAKEYVYAGSRMLAIEDYGLSSATPTPTATPTATPTPPTPTPTPPPPPGVPTGLRADVISPTQINLYWDANPAGENVTGYNVRMNGTQVLTNFGYASFPFTGLTPGTSYTFEVAAVNSSGAVSGWSSPVSGTTAQPPSAPTITQADVISSTQINVYWSGAQTGEDVAGYNVRMNGSQVLTGFTYTSFPFTNLTPNTTYTFEVQAVDSAGGASAWSQSQSATTAP